jgi:SAM-dependent methyltransferase
MTTTSRSFYADGGLNAETYDVRTLGAPGEIDFYVARALAIGGPVLELASGTGRVTWPIARAGVPIVGLEIEGAMLRQAERKRELETSEASDLARFVHGDMTDFDLGQQFALAIIPFRAFQMLLTVDQQRGALDCIRRHLRPGGTLIIDIFDPLYDSLVQERFTPRRDVPSMRHPITGLEVNVTVVERTNDRVHQRLIERWRFQELAQDGTAVREEEELLEIRWIFRYEMRHLFALCDFAVEEELSDFEGAPSAYGREQIWVVRRADL